MEQWQFTKLMDDQHAFQSPISGVNDWNLEGANLKGTDLEGFSLLLAELMIGTAAVSYHETRHGKLFQSPISGVNDWNERKR